MFKTQTARVWTTLVAAAIGAMGFGWITDLVIGVIDDRSSDRFTLSRIEWWLLLSGAGALAVAAALWYLASQGAENVREGRDAVALQRLRRAITIPVLAVPLGPGLVQDGLTSIVDERAASSSNIVITALGFGLFLIGAVFTVRAAVVALSGFSTSEVFQPFPREEFDRVKALIATIPPRKAPAVYHPLADFLNLRRVVGIPTAESRERDSLTELLDQMTSKESHLAGVDVHLTSDIPFADVQNETIDRLADELRELVGDLDADKVVVDVTGGGVAMSLTAAAAADLVGLRCIYVMGPLAKNEKTGDYDTTPDTVADMRRLRNRKPAQYSLLSPRVRVEEDDERVAPAPTEAKVVADVEPTVEFADEASKTPDPKTTAPPHPSGDGPDLPVLLLNSCVATDFGTYEYVEIDPSEAQSIVAASPGVESAIRHPDTAAALGIVLQCHVPVVDQQVSQRVGQTALVYKPSSRPGLGVELSAEETGDFVLGKLVRTR